MRTTQPPLGINHACFGPELPLIEFLDACANASVPFAGLWRDRLDGLSPQRVARELDLRGLKISSYTKAGFTGSRQARTLQEHHDDLKRALDEAVTLGASAISFICGGVGDKDDDIASARAWIASFLERAAEDTAAYGVSIGIEPLHPVFASDRSCVNTIAQAAALCSKLPGQSSIVMDAYHVWWEPDLEMTIASLSVPISVCQISDWAARPTSTFNGRLVPGDGIIDLPAFVSAVLDTGFTGPVEIEIFSEQVWRAQPAHELPIRLQRSYDKLWSSLISRRARP
jgi:sugar phosphate isomerase/epimerase